MPNSIGQQYAAQYIRMSTDTQTLSPTMQRAAIKKYADAYGLSIVESYEDEGRSGLTLRRRAEMQRLLSDVTRDDCSFTVVLVYDVSRWGRFQDTDESAYYEYHCRMHGVEVVYVQELFEHQRTPMAALLKSLKRAMAAEFSRELAIKVRLAQRQAVELGFQLGRTPCIGVDRMAVSPDRASRRKLADGERPRKGERVMWVPGPPVEQALVRRIFDEYMNSDETLAGVTVRLNREGVTARGRPFTLTMIKTLLDAEIFCGEFTWGRRKGAPQGQRRVDGDPAFIRVAKVMEPIVTREAWERAHSKRLTRLHVFNRSRLDLLAELKSALARNPALTATEMRGNACAMPARYREAFGSVREAMRLAGRDESAMRKEYLIRKARTHGQTQQFRRDLGQLMTREGIEWTELGHHHVFVIGTDVRLRFKLIWKRQHRNGPRWHFQRTAAADFDYMLLVPVEEDGTAGALLLMTPCQYRALRSWFVGDGSVGAQSFQSGIDLAHQLQRLGRA
jgi:DNA invertase Pin-like site-specific DNA recombinase